LAGVDLGPGLHNESTGLQFAERTEGEQKWVVTPSRVHRCSDEEEKCNAKLINVIAKCPIAVIDAPLALGSTKCWETTLIQCEALDVRGDKNWLKPSYTSAILAHTWRACVLKNLVEKRKRKTRLFEIFPASWFWLCEFDKEVRWKGDASAATRDRKVAWFGDVCLRLRKEQVSITLTDDLLDPNEADALPCVLCAILLSEGQTLLRLDKTEPPVLFPPRALWCKKLPTVIRDFQWSDYKL
jgi:hypothetical protein